MFKATPGDDDVVTFSDCEGIELVSYGGDCGGGNGQALQPGNNVGGDMAPGAQD